VSVWMIGCLSQELLFVMSEALAHEN